MLKAIEQNSWYKDAVNDVSGDRNAKRYRDNSLKKAHAALEE